MLVYSPRLVTGILLAVWLVAITFEFGNATTAPTTVFYESQAPSNPNIFSNTSLVASSSTGQFILAAGYAVFYSSNYGSNWAQISSAPTGPFVGIAMNSTGQQIMLCKSTALEMSYNYGSSWNAAGIAFTSGSLASVSASSSGQYIVAAVNRGGIWLSSNYGAAWTLSSAPNNTIWRSVSISGTGQFMIATAAAQKNGDTGYTSYLSGYVWLSSNYGVTWSYATGLTGYIYFLGTISSTGQYMTVQETSESSTIPPTMWTSQNYGATWQTVSPLGYQSMAISSNGQYVASASETDQILYVSNNFGMTWTPAKTAVYYDTCAVSGNGMYMLAGAVGYAIEYSANYGVTWKASKDTTKYSPMAFAISTTGDYMYGAGFGVGIIRSTTYGYNWTVAYDNSTAQSHSIACSSSGAKVVMGGCNSGNSGQYLMYVSTNYGSTWTSPSPTGCWVAVAMYNSGKYIAALDYQLNTQATIWISSNSGGAWSVTQSAPSDLNLMSLSMASSSKALYSGGQYLWKSTDFGATWSKVRCSYCGMGSTNTLTSINSIVVDSNASVVLVSAVGGAPYVGTFVYNSTTGYWQTGLNTFPTAITVAGTSPANLVAVTAYGLYVSTNQGVSWLQSNSTSGWASVASDASGVNMIASNTVAKAVYSTDVSSTTAAPSASPSAAPTKHPTRVPTTTPSVSPTASPSASPTAVPTASPSFTHSPSVSPTAAPSAVPTARPTAVPTVLPTFAPSAVPSFAPTPDPSTSPSAAPTSATNNNASAGDPRVYGAIVGVIGGIAIFMGIVYVAVNGVPAAMGSMAAASSTAGATTTSAATASASSSSSATSMTTVRNPVNASGTRPDIELHNIY